MRLKLVCILGALIFLFMYMCSCVTKVGAKPQVSGYSITRVHYDIMHDMNIYRVSTPKGTFEVLRETEKGGLCVLK